jgi:hypothetical protein
MSKDPGELGLPAAPGPPRLPLVPSQQSGVCPQREFAADTTDDTGRDQPSRPEVETACEQVP